MKRGLHVSLQLPKPTRVMIACLMRDMFRMMFPSIMRESLTNARWGSWGIDVDGRPTATKLGTRGGCSPLTTYSMVPDVIAIVGQRHVPRDGSRRRCYWKKTLNPPLQLPFSRSTAVTGLHISRRVSRSELLRNPRADNSQNFPQYVYRHSYHRQRHLCQRRTLARHSRHSVIEPESSLLAITQIGKSSIRKAFRRRALQRRPGWQEVRRSTEEG
jgi:hypothetical protein